MKWFIIKLCALFLFSPSLIAQNHSAKESFISPLKLSFSFSGNFGELRPDHLHSGLDFRTGGAIGLPVYASKEGYISRISVSSTGYGNALYITHPDGNTTVYAHLSRFIPQVANYVKDKQYYTENFQINVTLTPNEFEIKKGELIGWSGNTGNSGGPHLHFEVRNTKTEKAENPLFFIPGIKDNSAPVINALYVYPLSENSHVNRAAIKKRFTVIKSENNYSLSGNLPIEAYGKIGLGIQSSDDYSGSGIKCGIYSITLICDGKTVFGFKMDHLSFDQTRYANSQMDYEEEALNNRKVQRLYKQPGNKLDIYETLQNEGNLELDDEKPHSIQIIVSDAFHNQAFLKFKLTSRKYALPVVKFPDALIFSYDKENIFSNEEIKVIVPKGALYDNFNFFYGSSPERKGGYSKTHKIHDQSVPLQKPLSIAIKSKDLPVELQEKSLLVRLDKYGRRTSAGGEYSGGWVSTQSFEFGNYAVSVDTLAPVIIPLSIKDKKNLIERDQIRFRIGDNLSGIKTYRGEIDDQWILFEFNPKTSVITYIFDKNKIEFGKIHQLTLMVTDNKKNKSVYTATFFK